VPLFLSADVGGPVPGRGGEVADDAVAVQRRGAGVAGAWRYAAPLLNRKWVGTRKLRFHSTKLADVSFAANLARFPAEY